jgi:hypothetical protein
MNEKETRFAIAAIRTEKIRMALPELERNLKTLQDELEQARKSGYFSEDAARMRAVTAITGQDLGRMQKLYEMLREFTEGL